MPRICGIFTVAIFGLCVAGTTPVIAATCSAGYYLANGSCVACEKAYYCLGDDTRQPCPADTVDWWALYKSQGYDVLDVFVSAVTSWGDNGVPPYSLRSCRVQLSVTTQGGNFYVESWFSGGTYVAYTTLWRTANPGYYLSGYRYTTGSDWYNGVKACTNAPANAHYTGAGTPDEPKSGGAKDYNDCPWVCDETYYKNSENTCTKCDAGYYCTGGARTECGTGYYCDGGVRTACPAGQSTIGYGPGADEVADCGHILHINGEKVHLRSVKKTTPSLHVKIGDTVFYGNMSTTLRGRVRIKNGATVYAVYDDSM